MNQRLRKKCFIASAGLHLTLVVLLFVGPAFLSSKPKDENRPPIDFIPPKTIDEAFSGGGNPNARPPVPAPQPAPQPRDQQPAPPASREERQEKVEKVEPVKTPERDPDAVSTKPTRKLPKVSLKPVTRKSSRSTAKSSHTESDTRSEENERAQRLASLARSAANSVRESVSGSTTIEMPGPGGGGVPYANFLDALRKIYTDAWIVPDGVADNDSTATASVTIAKNGDVISARLTRSSGNSEIDRSVQMTLDRVRHTVPLPDSAKESQRTVIIKFNARVKRGLG